MYQNIKECLQKLVLGGDMEAEALSSYQQGTLEVSLNYADYIKHIAFIVKYLEEKGVKKGDRVGTLYRNCYAVPLLYLSCLAKGAVIVPLNPDYSLKEMEFVKSNAEIDIVIGQPELTDKYSEALAPLEINNFTDIELSQVSTTDLTLNLDTLPNVNKNHPALILYTSGTTSFPKGVVQSQGNIIENALSMIRYLRMEKLVQYSIMPFYHSHAVGFGLMTCLLCRGHLVMSPAMDPFNWAKIIKKENVTVTSMVPNLLNILVRFGVKAEEVPSLRFVFVSAAPLPKALAKEFEQNSGIRLVHGWGLSEYTNFATCINMELSSPIREKLFYANPTPTVGRALPGANVKVVDKNGVEVAEGEEGELYVKGPSLMTEYNNNKLETNKIIVDGWLKSGDQGYYQIVNGDKYFFIVSRIKELIIRSGQKISPLAVESHISRSVPQYANMIAVLGFEHKLYGEEIGLVIDAVDISEIKSNLDQALLELPVWQRPKVVIYGENIIKRTHTGKIQRRFLQDYFSEYYESSVAMEYKAFVRKEEKHAEVEGSKDSAEREVTA